MVANSLRQKRWGEGAIDDVQQFAPASNEPKNSSWRSAMATKDAAVVKPTMLLQVSAKRTISGPKSIVDTVTRAKDNISSHPTSRTRRKLKVCTALAVCACICWSLWLVMLNVAPNATINLVMNSSNLDGGSFWRFVDTPSPLFWTATIGLSLVGLGYVFVLVELIFTGARLPRVLPFNEQRRQIDSWKNTLGENAGDNWTPFRYFSSTLASISHTDSVAHKRMNLAMKLVDLVIETVMLVQVLETGTPIPLVVIFTVAIVFNALSCAIMMLLPEKRVFFAEHTIDLVCDLFFVILYPTLVLIFCLSAFSFDRVKYAINLAVFPPGWFERGASAVADPVQRAVIYKCLSSLRINSVLEFFSRVGVNLALCIRLHKVAGIFQASSKLHNSVYPKRQRLVPVILVTYAVLLVIFVAQSTTTSAAVCESYPSCAVFARRWTILQDDTQLRCPCLMLVDCDFGPKRYAEWLQPEDITEDVADLAAMGLLQAVQVINRFLPTLPGQLRQCTNLRFLSLMYTHTTTFPEWFGELTKLEYLFVEGKPTGSLVSLPNDMFDKMASLTYMHFGMHLSLTQVPSLQGLTNLKVLEFAGLLPLQVLPSFDSLHALERIVLSVMPLIDRLPDLGSIKNLQALSAYDRGAWCCNGFLGTCDLQNPLCKVHPVWGTPAASCLAPSQTASPATLKATAKFAATICGPVLLPTDLEPPPTESMVAQCNGTLYKQCHQPGVDEAMCYSLRFTVLSCVHSPFIIQMRRRQIQERVGDTCNPEFEAWLGCK